MAETYPDWLVGRWKIRMVGAPPGFGVRSVPGEIVWEFQSDGVFIEHIPGSEMYVTCYISHDESGTLYILRCDTDESFRPEGYRISASDGERMFLERPGQSGERIYLFEAERLTETGS